MIKSDILFTGFYGQANAGDDAFVEVASWGSKNLWNKNKSVFLGVSSKLPKTLVRVSGYPFRMPGTYNLQNKILIKNTDFLISAGGSTIHSKMSKQSPKQLAIDLKNNGKEIKIGAIGVSVGPFKTIEDEKAVQKYLRNIDFIALRDQRSFDYVNSLDLPYKPINAFDLAALMPEIYQYGEKVMGNMTIGVSICPVESVNNGNLETEQRRNNQLISLIRSLKDLDRNLKFKFFVINGNAKIGDLALTNKVIQQVSLENCSIINYTRDTRSIWEEINSCNVMISTRLHGAIFACFGKTPFLLVEYHEKCTDFLDDIGYDSRYRIYDADSNIKDTADLVYQWCLDQSNYSLPSKFNEKISQAKLNFTAIHL